MECRNRASDNEPGALDVGKYARCWVIAPMPGSLRIRWHKQGGEANDARSGSPLGVDVAINIIADPDWDEDRLAAATRKRLRAGLGR
jgi:hypothetical protein